MGHFYPGAKVDPTYGTSFLRIPKGKTSYSHQSCALTQFIVTPKSFQCPTQILEGQDLLLYSIPHT